MRGSLWGSFSEKVDGAEIRNAPYGKDVCFYLEEISCDFDIALSISIPVHRMPSTIQSSLSLVSKKIWLNPFIGEIWETEQGSQGGDEVNIILPERNYGWPVVSYGRWYEGPRVVEYPCREGFESPVVFWVPSIATSGMTFYTNDKIPQWKGNLFVGALQQGRISQTGHIQRIVFNSRCEEIRRETLLTSFKQRIREIREGPDGALYVLTDEDTSVLLRIDPLDTKNRASL